MGRLERHLDLNLIARVRAGIRPPAKPLKKIKPPRAASTYRAARRNAVREERQRVLAAKREARHAA